MGYANIERYVAIFAPSMEEIFLYGTQAFHSQATYWMHLFLLKPRGMDAWLWVFRPHNALSSYKQKIFILHFFLHKISFPSH